MTALLSFIDRLRQYNTLQIFTIYLRYLIGGAFIIAAFGMGKLDPSVSIDVMGASQIPLNEDTPPIIAFFKVIQASGLYWQFIGWSQIIAGILLMSQKFSKLGAAIFFGLILNIFIITLSYDFRGTPIITGLMLLATIYLIVWDLRSFLFLFKSEGTLVRSQLHISDNIYWTWLGSLMILSVLILSLLRIAVVITLPLIFIEGLLGFIIFFTLKKHKKSQLQV